MKLENGMRDSGGHSLDVFVRMPDSFPLEAAQVQPEDVICSPDVLLREGAVVEMGDGNVTHMMACRTCRIFRLTTFNSSSSICQQVGF